MKILIPTCRNPAELAGMVRDIEETAPGSKVIVSGLPASAAINRNYCLDALDIGDVAIMLDDDIRGFYPGWSNDLLASLVTPAVVMGSARLLNPDGTFGQTCSRCYANKPEHIEVFTNGECVLPTAAIAFRFRGHCFDEEYIGSGFEDSDWCMQYLRDDPGARFIQSNRCRLIHLNEMKSQGGAYWAHNQAYFISKWRPSHVTA